MPRYSKGLDWVVIRGAAERAIGELEQMYELPQSAAYALLDELVAEAAFTDRRGEAFNPAPGGYKRLTLAQYDWLREQVWAAARDETLDPQA